MANVYWDWNLLAQNPNTTLNIDPEYKTENTNVLDSNIIFLEQEKYNCWFDHLLNKKPQSIDYIKIYLNLNIEEEGGCEEYRCSEPKNYKLRRYLPLKYLDEFIKHFEQGKIYVDLNFYCCIVSTKKYTIKNYDIILNQKYNRILDRSFNKDNRLNRDIINIIKKFF